MYPKKALIAAFGLLTLATSILPAAARTPNLMESTDEDIPPVCRSIFKIACQPTNRETRFHPSGCAIDPGFSPQACRSDEYKPAPRPKDSGLPPCGIVYNGPCDPKKGI